MFPVTVTWVIGLPHRGILASLMAMLFLLQTATSRAANWPSWRGPNGDGTTPERSFPKTWSKERNVRWSVKLPERGNASPIVWENQVFVAQPVTADSLRSLMSFDRHTGDLLWQGSVRYARPEPRHETNTYCAASPVTDGERVYVHYGSAGLYCYDMTGRELWHRNFGPLQHVWGGGSSPVLSDELCFVYHGPGPGARLMAIQKETGDTFWQVTQPDYQAGADREDGFSGNANGMVGTFCTPMLIQTEQRRELVMIYPETMRGYDPRTGTQFWSCGGINPLVYCSPLVSGDVVVGMGGYFGPMVAVRVGGHGNVTETRRLWKSGRTPHRLGTGVVHDGYAYVFDRPGMAQCIDLSSGRSLWQERVRGDGANRAIWGSAVLADDLVYVINQSGDTVVMEASPEFNVVAVNGLGEKANTTPALSSGDIFIRTDEQLWCIADLSQQASR